MASERKEIEYTMSSLRYNGEHYVRVDGHFSTFKEECPDGMEYKVEIGGTNDRTFYKDMGKVISMKEHGNTK